MPAPKSSPTFRIGLTNDEIESLYKLLSELKDSNGISTILTGALKTFRRHVALNSEGLKKPDYTKVPDSEKIERGVSAAKLGVDTESDEYILINGTPEQIAACNEAMMYNVMKADGETNKTWKDFYKDDKDHRPSKDEANEDNQDAQLAALFSK